MMKVLRNRNWVVTQPHSDFSEADSIELEAQMEKVEISGTRTHTKAP